MNIFKIVSYENDLKKQNFSDEKWVNQVTALIKDYEEKSGVSIDKIYYGYDDQFDMNVGESFTDSATSVKYAFESLFQLYSDSEYVFYEMIEEVCHDMFGKNDRKSFNADEQLIFDDNELYLCCY